MSKNLPKTTGGLVNAYNTMKARRTKLKQQYDTLGTALEEIERRLLAAMNRQGVERLFAHGKTVSKTELQVPSVKDWTKFENFILSKRALYLLQRRVSSAAYREMLEMREGEAIPGVETFAKKGISVRAT